jgi:hypothetical protein
MTIFTQLSQLTLMQRLEAIMARRASVQRLFLPVGALDHAGPDIPSLSGPATQ